MDEICTIMHTNITSVPMAAESQLDSILHLAPIFVKVLFANMGFSYYIPGFGILLEVMTPYMFSKIHAEGIFC